MLRANGSKATINHYQSAIWKEANEDTPMTQLIVDPTFQAQLANSQETVELCDTTGRILGHFIPAIDKSKYKGIEPQISEEEIQRRLQEGGGRSLAEIMADLEKRT
jgi:hypothetical protein